MKTTPRMLIALCLLAMPAALTGCLAVAAGAAAGGGVAYSLGDLESIVDAQPNNVAAAAEVALRQLGIPLINKKVTQVDAQLTARTAQDKKVTIKVKKETETTSKLSIRVGLFGDEAMSRSIFDKIKSRL